MQDLYGSVRLLHLSEQGNLNHTRLDGKIGFGSTSTIKKGFTTYGVRHGGLLLIS